MKKIKLVDDQHCQFLIIVFAEQASGTLFKKKVVGVRGLRAEGWKQGEVRQQWNLP